ncbi:beta-ketoacyl-ACP synthase III [Actinocrispum wychmicini]|uniref:Beta-ketoacyl-[acyl-carrier-protein] synthase III n=1 Tax=Actinocrispum wychmicini TaxID=1213861 RepID=A0A4R2JTI0_9PSEU|nr:beta-ketoacyl-ACP synthase III [Actinocrispum wychmicini]TCO62292.1 3-oxoacyl-[acyl-carrier-protein] synthase-3 [Actinocrispum wychmicini]
MTAVVAGIGAVVPDRLVTNEMLAQRLDTSDEWIVSRTGIRQRYVAPPGCSTSDLAVGAAERAMQSAGVDDVGLVVLATTTPDRPCPGTAPVVASKLGLVDVPAYDVSAVCTGFIYALFSAAGALALGHTESALVIGADTFSTILDPADRTTSVIFGDGAGAVVLRRGHEDEPGALSGFHLGSDGALADLITVPDKYFRMDGKPVFMHAVRRMTESSRTVLAQSGWTAQTVDRLVGHQANVRILQAVSEQLGIPEDRAVVNLDRVGNTAAASIPLAMADAAKDGDLVAGHKVLLTAFGGGATWGAATLTWPDVIAG